MIQNLKREEIQLTLVFLIKQNKQWMEEDLTKTN